VSDDAARRAAEPWLAEARSWTEAALERELAGLSTPDPRLAEALRYALLGGGKRLRPALVRLFGELHGADPEALRRPAVALECVHTYSLVHDDLPCMDDDDLRRGRPTCHKVFGEATAVLVGDALLTWSFELVAHGPHAAEAVRVLARAAGAAGMVGGQALDLAAVAGRGARAEVERIHRCKTAALLGAACEVGALAGGARAHARAAARRYGEALGLCFQAVDDVLDVTGGAALGKTPGKDAAQDKLSLVAVLGLEGAQAEARRLADAARGLAREVSDGLPAADGGALPASLPGTLIDLLLERSR